MGIAILIFFVFIVLFTFGVYRGTKVMGKIVGNIAKKNHGAAETMVEEQRVPEEWIADLREKILEAGQLPTGHGLKNRLAKKMRRRVLKRIKGIKGYFTNAPVFESPEAKEIVFSAIGQQENRWETEDIDTLLAEAQVKEESGEQ